MATGLIESRKVTKLRCPLCGRFALDFTRRGSEAEFAWHVHCWKCAESYSGEPRCPKSPPGWLGRLAEALDCRPGALLYEPGPVVANLERASVKNGGAPPRVKAWVAGLSRSQIGALHNNLLHDQDPWWFLLDKGISQQAAREARLGYHPIYEVLVIPFANEPQARVPYKTRKVAYGTDTLMPAGRRQWPLYIPNQERLAACRWTLICEGETDTLRALSARLPAAGVTCGAGGAWRPEWTAQLVKLDVRSVVICLDVGAERVAERFAGVLRDAALKVKVLDLRELGLTKKNSDLSDWLNNDGTRTELLGHLKATGGPRRHTPRHGSATSNGRGGRPGRA